MTQYSTIAIETEPDTFLAIHCHSEGHLLHNGAILHMHYQEREKVEQLIKLGSLHVLQEEIGEKQNFDQPSHGNWCLAYTRDRKEPENMTRPKKFSGITNLSNDSFEFLYIYRLDNSWYFSQFTEELHSKRTELIALSSIPLEMLVAREEAKKEDSNWFN